jgi:ureidoglycolate lyase
MQLVARALTAEAFAPFGEVIEARGPGEPINAGTTTRYADLASLDLRGPGADPVLGIYVARARRFPLAIAKLERHREAAQVFLPLGTQRFVVVVAPGIDAPDWSRVQAFVAVSGQGVVIARGCWHHGLVALGDGDRFAVIEGAGYRNDTQELAAPGEIALVSPA